MAGLLQIFLFMTFLISAIYSLKVSTEGSQIAGNKLNILCTLQQHEVENETDFALSLEKQDSNAAGPSGVFFNSDENPSVSLSFDPVQYSDGGVYVCTAQFNSTAEYIELIVEYILIVEFPLPSVQITASPKGPIFIGENISLHCRIVVDIINIPYTIRIEWENIEGFAEEVNAIETSSTHEFVFDQLVIESEVIYRCAVMITPTINDPFLTGVNYTNKFTLTATSPPNINITHNGIQNIATTFQLNCSNEDYYTNNVTLVWYKRAYQDMLSAGQFVFINSTDEFLMSPHYSVLYFQSLSVNDAGIYMCIAVLNERVIASSQTELLLTTPFNISTERTTPFYIIITWSKPLLFVNQDTNYSITTNVTNDSVTLLSTATNTVSFNLSGLQPYQYVNVTIKAITGQREGDPVSMVYATNEYIPGAVEGLSIVIINDTSIVAKWEPVSGDKSNGVIIGYQLSIFRGNQFTIEVYNEDQLADDETTATITGLSPETRYLLEARAVNSQYRGVTSHHLFYTREGVLPPPMNIEVHILNHTHISIRWDPVTDPKGFTQGYNIMTTAESSLVSVANRVVISNNTGSVYTVRIATINSNNVSGPWSQWITNAGSRIIQLRGGPFKSCSEWSERDMNLIIRFFKQSLHNFTISHCNCSVINTFVNDFLSCDETIPTDAIYRTNITGIWPYTTNTLVDVISKWIADGATITFGITQITLNSKCMVAIATTDEPLCGQYDGTPMNDTPTNSLTVVLPTVLVTIIVFILLVVSCIVCIGNIWKAFRIQTWRFNPCPTPEGHPWVCSQQHHFHFNSDNTVFTNTSIEDFEDEEGMESTSKEWAESPSREWVESTNKEWVEPSSKKREEFSLSSGGEEKESDVYDPSNLTVIYESDNESTKL